jgi:hypothetical protein
MLARTPWSENSRTPILDDGDYAVQVGHEYSDLGAAL